MLLLFEDLSSIIAKKAKFSLFNLFRLVLLFAKSLFGAPFLIFFPSFYCDLTFLLFQQINELLPTLNHSL